MMEWEFDQKNKEALAHMIVIDELPFSFVENSGFNYYQRVNQPLFDVPCRGEWLHIRCATHIVNLIVQDGIKHVGKSIESIRCSVKWIKKLGTRIEIFDNCTRSASCDNTKSLVLDIPTRWNSTYNMLEVAHEYKDAFARYDLEDVEFRLHIRSKGHSVPTAKD
nr:hypothetical protein [Tanacetum cinerariifolium]